MGQYRRMRRNKRGPLTVAVLAGVLAISLVLRLVGRTPHQPAPAPPKRPATTEFVHPIIPSEPVVHPAVAPCRAPDLRDLVGAIRQTEKKFLPTLKKEKQAGAAAACRKEGENPKWSAFVDLYTKDATNCVARDAELDSQWNQVQSAVMAFDGCIDCTRPRAARATSCQRAGELLDAAEKATPNTRQPAAPSR
jgi:hypothetical protein